MNFYVDTVHQELPTFNWANVAPFESGRRERKSKPLMELTALVTAGADSFDFFTTDTGPSAPTTTPSAPATNIIEPTKTLSESSVAPFSAALVIPFNIEVERIAKQRVQLLAAKYARGTAAATEIEARLEILNRRLLDRAPRVSVEQVGALENANEQLARIRAAREERSKRLGIST